MSDELPEGWAEAPLSDLITELRNGISTRPSLEPPGTPILRISAARAGGVALNDRRYLPDGDKLLGTFGLRDRDLLFTRYNGSLELLGVCGMVRGLGAEPLLYPDKLMRVRVRDDLSPEYVELFFRTPLARDEIMAHAKSSAGQQGISGGDLKEQRVAVAPFPEQRRIVAAVEALLEQVNRARERLDRVPLILKRFRQAVLAAACSGRLTEEWRGGRVTGPLSRHDVDIGELPDLPDFPDAWGFGPLEAFTERFQYGTSEKADADEMTGVPVLRMGNIQDGALDLSDLKYIKHSRQLDPFLVKPGDVLFNRTNSPELVGKSAVVTSSGLMTFASYIVRAQLNERHLRPEFASWWLNSGWGREWARHVRTDGVSQSNINATKLAAMPIPVPSLAEQDEAIRRGTKLLLLADTIERKVHAASARADRLPQALLSKAFSGELVPTEADLARAEGRTYETAAELLARAARQTNDGVEPGSGRHTPKTGRASKRRAG